MTKPTCILALLALLVTSSTSLRAANIAFVSFHAGPNDAPNANAANNGFTLAPDVGYTDLLRNAGHTVNRYLSTDTPDLNFLNSMDLVIISRSVPSGNFELDPETAAWNGVTAPTIILGGYILRNNRLGFTTGTTIPDTTTPIKLTVNEPTHPIFAGISLDGANTMTSDYAGIASIGAVTQRGISVNSNPAATGGKVLATAPVGSPAAPGMIIGEWQAGATMADSPPDTLGGHRLVLLTGSREGGTNPNTAAAYPSDVAGIYDLTPEGAQIFLNAANYMAVPEPSTFALLGLGAAVLLVKLRRK